VKITALATDYDGTIARDGQVDEQTKRALEHFKASGRCLVLVTGRELEDLQRVCPLTKLFDSIVAENGAVYCRPATGRLRLLASPPPQKFLARLNELEVRPLSVGHVIVATLEPCRSRVLGAIDEFKLPLQVVLNKGAVMVLPRNVDKATGLRVALAAMQLKPAEVAGVGDAENDYSFLRICGCSAAVANALPALKEQVDCVLRQSHGGGVRELIRGILGEADEPVPAFSQLNTSGRGWQPKSRVRRSACKGRAST
jgi:hydroxymethylpyrimidine pyrophosphatase-like HAD family hydrolase